MSHAKSADKRSRIALLPRCPRTLHGRPRFLRRDWLTDLIGLKLRQGGTRYVVVIGAPASGAPGFLLSWPAVYHRALAVLSIRSPPVAPISSTHCRIWNKPEALDDYAIRYRIRRQIAGDGCESAYVAITPEWMLFKRKRTGDNRSFHADIMQVAQSLRAQTPPNVVAFVRCCLVDAVLLARAAVLPPTVASIWAICGQHMRAESLISLISNPGKRAEKFLQLSHGLEATEAIESSRDALRSAVTAAKTNSYYGDRLRTLNTVLAAKFVDADVATFALDVATMTEATVDVETGTELSWQHQDLAAIYEGAASFLPTKKLAELRTRLEQF